MKLISRPKNCAGSTLLAKACNGHLGGIRKLSVDYLIPYKADVTCKETRIHLKTKTNRGWNNWTTAHMLCPYRKLKEFDEDPDKYIPSFHSHTNSLILPQIYS